MSHSCSLPLARSDRWRSVARWSAAIVLFFAVGVLGTSLITANGDNDRAVLTDEVTAVRVLGRPLPAIHDTTVGLARFGIGVDQATGPQQAVHIAYALEGKPVLLLTVNRGTLLATDPGDHLTIGGQTAVVSAHPIADGSTDVAYVW